MKNKSNYRKIKTVLEANLKLLKMAHKGSTKQEKELIILTVIHGLKEMIDDIVKNWPIAES